MDSAPRSLDEVRALLMRDDGWLPSLNSYLPHRVLDDLLQRSEGARPTFPDSHLPGAALAAVHVFLTNTMLLPPPNIATLIRDIGPQHRQIPPASRSPGMAADDDALAWVIERDQLRATEIARHIHEVMTKTLGPIDTWGVRTPSEGPVRKPTVEARLAALENAITAAKVHLSMVYFAEFADAADHVGKAAMSKDASWRYSAPIKGFIRSALQQYYTQGVTAIAYQDFRELYGLDALVTKGVGDKEATLVGGMLVDIARDLRTLRPLRTAHPDQGTEAARVALENALQKISEREGTPFVPRRGLVDRTLAFAEEVMGILSKPLGQLWSKNAEFATDVAKEASGAVRRGLAVVEDMGTYNKVVAARVLSNVYQKAKDRRRYVGQDAKEALTEQRFPQFLALTKAQQLLTSRNRAAVLSDRAITASPMNLLRATLRQGYTHKLLWQYIALVEQQSPHAAPGHGLPKAREFFAQRSTGPRSARDEAPRDVAAVLPDGVTDEGVLVAAIAVLQHRRGVPIAQLWDDLDKGRLPGVRGSCQGDHLLERASQREWDLHCRLTPDDTDFVYRSLQAAEMLRVAHEASATHSGWFGTLQEKQARTERQADVLADDAHLREPARSLPKLDPAQTFHRAPLLDGLPGFLISEYAHQYADGRVRVRSDAPGGQPTFIRLAVLEAHQTALALMPPAARARAAAEDPIDVHWVRALPARSPGIYQHEFQHTPSAGSDRILTCADVPDRYQRSTTLWIQGILPPAAHDALAAVGVHPPAGYPASRARPMRPPTPLEAGLADGTQAHLHGLAVATRELFGDTEPSRGLAARVKPLQVSAADELAPAQDNGPVSTPVSVAP